jgi:glycosyltransferase involved in cell wall biosynthesis
MAIKKKICFIATFDSTVNVFLINHLRKLAVLYNLTVITNTTNPRFLLEHGIKAQVIPLKFTRKIKLLSDFYCFIKLIHIFRNNGFASVQSVTPKAGFIGMLASFFLRVPLRVHTFTGQVWVTKSGFSRFILKYVDRLIGVVTTHNFVDSPSQRDFLIKERVLSFEKTIVFGSGSIAGVDLLKFKPNKRLGQEIKDKLEIPSEGFVFIYLGRLVRDKGVLDLAKAFSEINHSKAFLIMIGSDEENLSSVIKELCANKIGNIRLIDFTNDPYKYLACSNVLCLPSYREGFGAVIIEAAAMGIPAIASKIYGITDATIDNETGILHQPGDINGLKLAMYKILQDQHLFKRLSNGARRRAIERFDAAIITSEWVNFYKSHLS